MSVANNVVVSSYTAGRTLRRLLGCFLAAGTLAGSAGAQPVPRIDIRISPATKPGRVGVLIDVPNGNNQQFLDVPVTLGNGEVGPQNIRAKRDRITQALADARDAWNRANPNNRIAWNFDNTVADDLIRVWNLPNQAERGTARFWTALDRNNQSATGEAAEDLEIVGCPANRVPRGMMGFDDVDYELFDPLGLPHEFRAGITFNDTPYIATLMGDDDEFGGVRLASGGLITDMLYARLIGLVPRNVAQLAHAPGTGLIDVTFAHPGTNGLFSVAFGTSSLSAGAFGEVGFVPEPATLVLACFGGVLAAWKRRRSR